MPSAAWSRDQSKAIEVTCLTQVAQYAKRCMVWRSIEGFRTNFFYLCGAVRQSNSPDSGGAVCYGILCHPSLTGEFDCLRLICRQCSAWHLVLPKSNGQVRLPSIASTSMKHVRDPSPPESNEQGRLPSIAPKAMKRLGSYATRVERASCNYQRQKRDFSVLI